MRARIAIGSLSLGLTLASAADAGPDACPTGQSTSSKTMGHCCWAGQTWSLQKSACIGAPECPAGFDATVDACVAKPAAVACPSGQSASTDTAGHCCWGGQAWSTTRGACVGAPQCPTGFDVSEETCLAKPRQLCQPGQSVTQDTDGHCCWPGQAWLNARQTCVGAPQCPPDLQVEGESCVDPFVAPVEPARPPPIAAQPPLPNGPLATAPQAGTEPPAPAPSTSRADLGLRIGGWIGVGLGGVGVVASVPLLLLSKGPSQCPSTYLSASSCVSLTQRNAGIALAVVGGTGFVTGLVLLGAAAPPQPARAATTPRASLLIGPTAAALDWTF